MRWLAVLLMSLIVAPILACAWDDDTLSMEAKGLPTVLNAITGRIEVNPPEYYQRRIELSTQRIKEDPLDFEAYDNLGVAHDKLGDFAASISILEMKRKKLTQANIKPTADPMEDPWYRYHANLGTVYAHEWIRRFPKQNQEHLNLALEHLKKSIEINPDAHFGREVVQVKILELLARKYRDPQPEFAFPEEEWFDFVEATGSAQVIEGIIGMMVLGAGADSPDLIALIQASLHLNDGHLYDLCTFRLEELKARHLQPKLDIRPDGPMMPRHPDALKRQFKLLRENAVLFRQNHHAYITRQLAAGKHPDSHPDFWAGYTPVPMADYQRLDPPRSSGFKIGPIHYGVIAGISIAVVVALSRLAKRSRKHH